MLMIFMQLHLNLTSCVSACESDKNFSCSGVKKIEVHRGQEFVLFLIALDQLKASTSTQVSAIVQKTSRLKMNQGSQNLPKKCSNLSYTLYSTEQYEELTLYPDGPCRDAAWSGQSCH